MQTEQVLFALLRNTVCGQPVPEGVKAACTAEMLENVYTLAAKHDLAHLAGQALNQFNLPESDGLTKCKAAAKQAIFRYVRLDHTYGQVCNALEMAQIPFVPLKGSILRTWYPEPWMRTSSDIDILVQPDQLETAEKMLTEQLQFTKSGKGNHDISLFSPVGVHLELHYTMVAEDDEIQNSSDVLSRIWEDVTPVQPGAYGQRMSDAMFYFYHIAHMAKHVVNGGCGIRPFLDLWVLNNRTDCNAANASALLTEGGLLAFAQAAEKLSAVWFAGQTSDPMTDQLARFVLDGGAFGSVENHVTLHQTKRGGKIRYAFSRAFLPYESLRFYYPVLERHRWLTPFFQPVRWCRILFKGGAKQSVRELKMTAAVSQEAVQSTAELLQYLEL